MTAGDRKRGARDRDTRHGPSLFLPRSLTAMPNRKASYLSVRERWKGPVVSDRKRVGWEVALDLGAVGCVACSGDIDGPFLTGWITLEYFFFYFNCCPPFFTKFYLFFSLVCSAPLGVIFQPRMLFI